MHVGKRYEPWQVIARLVLQETPEGAGATDPPVIDWRIVPAEACRRVSKQPPSIILMQRRLLEPLPT